MSNDFESKHKELLGRLVRIYMGIDLGHAVRTDEKIGEAVLDFIRMVDNEAMRDARERANQLQKREESKAKQSKAKQSVA